MRRTIVTALLIGMLLSTGSVYAAELLPGMSDSDTQEVQEDTSPVTEIPIESEPILPDSTPGESPTTEETFPLDEPDFTPDEEPESQPESPVIEIPVEEPDIPDTPISQDERIVIVEPPVELPSEEPGIVIGESDDKSLVDDELVIGYSIPEIKPFSPEQVICNSNIQGSIDPYKINGDRQINYQDIQITNQNEMPIQVYLKGVVLAQVGGIQLVSDKPGVDNWDKWMMVNLTSSTIESGYLTETMEPFHFGIVQPGETLTLSLNGEVNGCCTDWSKDDMVNLSFHFEFTPLER